MSTKKLLLILIAATFLAYFSSFSNPFIWDDEQFITRNIYVQNFAIGKIFTTNTVAGAGVVSNYYRPLTTLSFAIDAKIWGDNAFGFHLTNFFVHAGAGLVLFGFLLELGLPTLVGFFIALFFLVHPIQTEAVTYINSRGDSLYALFLLSSLFLFTRFIKNVHKFTFKYIISIIILFILSLLSKEIALAGIGLFIVVLLYCFSVEKSKKSQNIKAVKQFSNFVKEYKFPLLTISGIFFVIVIYLFLRLTFLNFGNSLNFYGIDNEYTKSLAIRLFIFCKVLWIYLGLLVWPYPLHMERSVELIRSFISPWVLGILGSIGGLTWLGILELRKKRTAWILFGMLWFLVMLVPSSGVIPINGILYEHWLYVPMVGFLILLYGICKFFFSFQFSKKLQSAMRKVLISFGIVIVILHIIFTIRQNNIWADPITFYTYTLSFAPQSARLHTDLAIAYAQQGQMDKAIVEYKKSLVLVPLYPQTHFDLGNAYVAKGEFDLAKLEYEEALRLAPNFEPARRNLEILEKQK